MGEAYRFEAVVVGTGLASLFAGYLLKKSRVRFAVISGPESGISGYEKCLEQAENWFDTAIAKMDSESKEMIEKCYRKISAQVGIADLQEDIWKTEEDAAKRLRTLLEAELEEELNNLILVNKVQFDHGAYVFNCGEDSIESEYVIGGDKVFAAGLSARSIIDEKQKRLGESMKRLRIKEGKRGERKLVYVTHSRSWFYVKEAITVFAMKQGTAPMNPFMNYGFYLNGAVEKECIEECCHQMIRSAQELWVFGPVSEAIMTDIAVAVMEGKVVRFFSISENVEDIHELELEEVSFEREVHAGQIKKPDLLNFVRRTAPKTSAYVQMSLFDFDA